MANSLIKTDETGTCHLFLSEHEIEALLSVLQLAKNAATVIAQQETIRNGTSAAAKMNRIALDANELMRIIAQSVNIGEPNSVERN